MKFYDDLKISELEDGKQYAMTQGGNGYSDGVWVTKNGEEITLRHFWTPDIKEYDKEGFYYSDESDGVYYPKEATYDQIYVVHKDIMQVAPDAVSYFFEEMTLIEFYELVFLETQEKYNSEYVFPAHLQGKMKVFDRHRNLMHQN